MYVYRYIYIYTHIRGLWYDVKYRLYYLCLFSFVYFDKLIYKQLLPRLEVRMPGSVGSWMLPTSMLSDSDSSRILMVNGKDVLGVYMTVFNMKSSQCMDRPNLSHFMVNDSQSQTTLHHALFQHVSTSCRTARAMRIGVQDRPSRSATKAGLLKGDTMGYPGIASRI